jgi:glycosyltransferase involved in cell wall biosynthesis
MRLLEREPVLDAEAAAVYDVSVLTPSYEYGRFIEDALLSVARQTGIRAEHIVQDGGSGDSTASILESFGTSVRWTIEPDRGQSDALNKAIRIATGTWIGWLNADEFYLPGALRRLVEHGEATQADVVFGDTLHCDEHGRLQRLVPQHPLGRFVLRTYGAFIDSGSTLFRRSALGEHPWDETNFPWGIMDWDVFLRLLGEGASFAYLPRPIGVFRIHASRQTAKAEQFAEAYPVIARKHGLHLSKFARRTGRNVHRLSKLAHGSYVRQAAALSLRGADLRWFAPGTEDTICRTLYRRCYRDIP